MDPKWTKVVAIVIVVVLVGAGIGVYYYLTRPSGCHLSSTGTIVFDQPEAPDSLDPAYTFTTPGWAVVQQIYQTLVTYDNSSWTTYVGQIAKNWTVSSDQYHYNFTLWSGEHFSNGDTLNAYTMWFSLYRSLIMNQGPAFILGENFGYPGLSYYSNASQIDNETHNLTQLLNTGNFANPSSSLLQAMEMDNQSFRVLSPTEIELSVGSGYLASTYGYLFATLSGPIAAAVDPAVVQANGGVQADSPNTWLTTHAVGSGPYVLSAYDPNSGATTITPDPNYWGAGIASQVAWNNAVQPAKQSVQLATQSDPVATVQDMKTGAVAGVSVAYLGPSEISQLKGTSCVVVNPLPTVYGSTSGSWYVYMNQSQAPFDNLSVREAVVHAINYPQIIDLAFGGYGSSWVGPVPPGYPYYNPGNLSPYAYDLNLAKQEMANSPYAHTAPPTVNFMYIKTGGGDWDSVVTLLTTDLAAIGITINPVGLSLSTVTGSEQTLSNGVCGTATTQNGGPFPMGIDFYTADYISPDDYTQNIAEAYGSANQCEAGYNNATMETLIYAAAASTDPTTLTSDYTQITKLMYDNYTDAWLVVPTSFQVYSPLLHGVIANPMASALPYAMFYNTETTTSS
ncbi:MAG: ABC transporter substrate-binding protein [Thermoplasmata archaeon]